MRYSLCDGTLWQIQAQNGAYGPYFTDKMPADIHKVLEENGVIKNTNIHGHSEDCQWVSDLDWLYRTSFDCLEHISSHGAITFMGINTFSEITLNGEKLGETNDVYLPFTFDVTGKLQEHNELEILVKAPLPILHSIKVSPELESKVALHSRARVLHADYTDYLGPKPCLIHMGPYDEIFLETWEERIEDIDISFDVDLEGDRAFVEINALCDGGDTLAVEILDPEGECIARREQKLKTSFLITIGHPRLWWPVSLGEQPRYTVITTLLSGGCAVDRKEHRLGLRKLTMVGDLDFCVNGRPLKLWGACLTPFDTFTNVYDFDRMEKILELAENAGCNCLRAWGEDRRFPDRFYEECDRRGIMVWQDFFTANAVYDRNEEIFALIRKEALYQIKRLKHRPCILLWCGGNETLMLRDFAFPDEASPNREFFAEVLAKDAASLDPDRTYLPSSPWGGAYENDPLVGDTHGYTHLWNVPGYLYPVFLSENNRVSPPALRTMKRMMAPEDLWPEGYDGRQGKNSPNPWPDTWNYYNSNDGRLKVGEFQDFYDATDIEAQLYRLGWAHGNYLRDRIERYRRGYAAHDERRERITKGHLLWELNCSCNHIFFGVVDYFCEPYIAYYALKHAYEPLLLSFDKGNFIYLWATNDTPCTVRGQVHVEIFDAVNNRVADAFELPFSVEPDESKVLCDLNRFKQFSNMFVLHAYAVDEEGHVIAESIDLTRPERRIRFPEDGRIEMRIEGDELVLTSDRYARSVELLGFGADGDEFGWLFEDNYFDMLPGRQKRVKILRGHTGGRVSAKAYYFREATETAYV